jgi:hypothetical protein
VLVILAIWSGGIAFIAWDTTRRNLAGCRQLLWLGAALVPVLGLAVYLIARPFLPKPDDLAEGTGKPKKRVTFLKAPLPGGPKRMPTIPAIEYLRGATRREGRGGSDGRVSAHLRYMLSIVEGPHTGQTFIIYNLPACIGRGPGCAIRLDNDRGVSRRHAELYQQADVLRLRDLDSTHGTNVNGFTIDDKGLTPGDKIRVGYSLLIVKAEK